MELYDQWRLDSGEPEEVTCPSCRGRGRVYEARKTFEGWIDCPECQGSGELDERQALALLASRRAEQF